MKDKESAAILINLLKKYPLTAKERAAVLSAVGILGWSLLAENKLKSLKRRKKKDLE